jgi:hypothetical protein
LHRGRTVYGLKLAPFEIADDLSYAVYPARAYGIEKLCGELWKRRTNAAAGNDFRSSPPKKIGELSHPIEVRLQSRQENEVILFCLKGIEGAVPVLVVKTDIESVGVDQRCDMQAAYRLHHVARATFDSTGSEMCADYKSASFFRAGGKGTVQMPRLTSRD